MMISSSSISFLLPLALMFIFANNLGINANPDEKFAECCHKISGLPADVAAIGCKYPPGSLSIAQQRVLAKVFPGYIGCYAAHKNNRECCARGGCTHLFKPCQDLCDGEHPPQASVKYIHCNVKKQVISDCNKAAWGGQNAAVKRDLNLAAMKLQEVQELVSEVLNDLQSESEEHSLWA